MSYDRNGKKRCIVKKLNFEDCVVTNLKGKGRKKARLRATVRREVETPENERRNARRERENLKSPDAGSPILASKNGRSFRRTKESDESRVSESETSTVSSPVLTSDEKPERSEKSRDASPKRNSLLSRKPNGSERTETQNAVSPVLSTQFNRSKTFFSVPAKKKLIMPCSPVLSAKRKRGHRAETAELVESDPLVSQVSSIVASPSRNDDCYFIESATSEEPQRSFSPEIKSCGPSSPDGEPHLPSETSKRIGYKTPDKNGTEETDLINLDSGKKRKKCKKDSLCARLEMLNKRSVSERRIWEHEKKIMKIERGAKISLKVVSFWREATRFVLKCKPLGEPQLLENDLDKNIILIVDGEIVNDVCKVKDNSVISVSPPWQKLILSKLNCAVLLSIVCLEILNQDTLPVTSKIFKSVIIDDERKSGRRFLIDCLFSL